MHARPLPKTAIAQRGTSSPAAGRPADEELIRRARAGDEDAFAQIVRRYGGRAFHTALGLLGHEEDARDTVQEAFVRVYSALDRFDLSQSFYTWLHRIVVNLAIDRLRKRRRRLVALDDVEEPENGPQGPVGPEAAAGRSETAERVRAVVERLPEKYRTVLVLREWSGLSCKEIARIVGTSHATARWRLHVARKMFRERWEALYGAQEEGR